MNKNLNDYLGKYFNRIYFLPQLTNLEDLYIKIVDEGLKSIKLNSAHFNEIINDIQNENDELNRFASYFLNTMRKIKAFKKIFLSNILRLERDIFIPDLILLSFVESSNLKLFNIIRRNQYFLSARYLLTNSIFNRIIDVKTAVNKEKSDYENFFNKNNITDEDKDVVSFLCPHIPFILNYTQAGFTNFRHELNLILDKIEKKQRIVHPFIFPKYFHSFSPDDAIEVITSKKLKDNILQKFENEDNIISLTELLQNIFPPGTANIEFRRMSLDWIEDKIIEKNLNTAYKLVLAISIIAKKFSELPGFLMLSEKTRAAFLTWTYLKRPNANQSLLIELQKWDNSDEFASNAVFYSLNADRTPDKLKINEKIIIKMVKEFLARIGKKIKSSNSIYDKNIFDVPTNLLWRWHEATDFIEKKGERYPLDYTLNDYLFKLFKDNSKDFDTFLSEFTRKNLRTDITKLDEEIFDLIPSSQLFDIFEFYKANGKINELSAHNVLYLTKWAEEYEKSINLARE
ncbi:MAG: hypothetical protein GF353_22495 [Candidatus Lokiarchaeota archaeon]|nr:hypothetical protein [Candidatus Lokiarchaeota archaeon]